MKLTDLLNLPALPQPWEEGEKIPWNEPGFSKRMLREHLTQQHDHASRRFALIDRHVEWIHAHILGGNLSKILDLGCGPGLYASRMGKLGHAVTGIDFSPASIEYARSISAGLPCIYRLEDVRSADFGQGNDLAMFIFGELNVFKPAQALEILRKCAAALRPGGSLLLEVSTYASTRGISRQPRRWQALPGGLFSDKPHLLLTEAFWNAENTAAVERFVVVDAASGEVNLHAAATVAYRLAQLKRMLRQAGFRSVRRYPTLSGEVDPRWAGFWVLAAQR